MDTSYISSPSFSTIHYQMAGVSRPKNYELKDRAYVYLHIFPSVVALTICAAAVIAAIRWNQPCLAALFALSIFPAAYSVYISHNYTVQKAIQAFAQPL